MPNIFADLVTPPSSSASSPAEPNILFPQNSAENESKAREEARKKSDLLKQQQNPSLNLLGLLRFRGFNIYNFQQVQQQGKQQQLPIGHAKAVRFQFSSGSLLEGIFDPWEIEIPLPSPNALLLIILIAFFIFAFNRLRNSNYGTYFGLYTTANILEQEQQLIVESKAMADRVHAMRVAYQEKEFLKQNPHLAPAMYFNAQQQQQQQLHRAAHAGSRPAAFAADSLLRHDSSAALAAEWQRANTVPWYTRLGNMFSSAAGRQHNLLHPDDRLLAHMYHDRFHMQPHFSHPPQQQHLSQQYPIPTAFNLMRWNDGEDSMMLHQNLYHHQQQQQFQQHQTHSQLNNWYATNNNAYNSNQNWGGWPQQQRFQPIPQNQGWNQTQARPPSTLNNNLPPRSSNSNAHPPPPSSSGNSNMMFPRQDFNTSSATMSQTQAVGSRNNNINNNNSILNTSLDVLSPMNVNSRGGGGGGGNSNAGSTPAPGTAGSGRGTGGLMSENNVPLPSAAAQAQAVKAEMAARASNKPENFDETGRPLSVKERLERRAAANQKH